MPSLHILRLFLIRKKGTDCLVQLSAELARWLGIVVPIFILLLHIPPVNLIE